MNKKKEKSFVSTIFILIFGVINVILLLYEKNVISYGFAF